MPWTKLHYTTQLCGGSTVSHLNRIWVLISHRNGAWPKDIPRGSFLGMGLKPCWTAGTRTQQARNLKITLVYLIWWNHVTEQSWLSFFMLHCPLVSFRGMSCFLSSRRSFVVIVFSGMNECWVLEFKRAGSCGEYHSRSDYSAAVFLYRFIRFMNSLIVHIYK